MTVREAFTFLVEATVFFLLLGVLFLWIWLAAPQGAGWPS